jgi:hypothetical protein
MSSPAAGYSWLDGQGAIQTLDNPQQSILTWYGGTAGYMPQGGSSSNTAATTAISAWGAAGHQNN